MILVLLAAISAFLNAMFHGVVTEAVQASSSQQVVVDSFAPHAGDAEIPTSYESDHSDSATASTLSFRSRLLGPSVLSASVFLLHLAYLVLVAWDQIFKQSKDDIEFLDLVLPIILCLAYIVPVVMYFYGWSQSSTKIASLSLFSVVYLTWGLIDLAEISKESKNRILAWFARVYEKLSSHRVDSSHDHISSTLELRKRLWMALDLSIAVALSIAVSLKYFFHESDLANLSIWGLLTLKEIVICLTIGAYFVVTWIVKASSRSTEVLSHKLWQDTIESGPTDQPKLELPDYLKERLANQRLKILVVNCGTGRRTTQTLKLFGLKPSDVELVGYNHDPRVEGFGENNGERFIHDHFTSKDSEATKLASESDVILVLHSTYDRDEMMRAEKVLRNMDQSKDQLVLARGFADHSVLATVCFQIVDRGILETPSYHHWADWYLKDLAEHIGMSPFGVVASIEQEHLFSDMDKAVSRGWGVDHELHAAPCALIRQHLRVTPFSIACIHDYLSRQFSPERADLLRQQLEAIMRSSEINQRLAQEVNADDYVFAFRFDSQDRIKTKSVRVVKLQPTPREPDLSSADRVQANSNPGQDAN